MRRCFLSALVLIGLAGPLASFGGVLPEDRADALYHRYSGGGITIQGPSVLVRKSVGEKLSLSANYYEDLISSASIDVKLAASPYKETREQKSLAMDYLHGKSTYSAGIINSVERDYKADTTFYSISQDMFGDLTTLTMAYKRGWDRVYSDVKVDGKIINNPNFNDGAGFAAADHRGYALSLSQILTRNLILGVNYEVLTDEGYLASPYRKIRFVDPSVPAGVSFRDQIYPKTRTSNALSSELKYYLSYRAALSGQYRYYTDTWGIAAHTLTLGYTHPARKRWIFDGSLRYYRQSAADFYSDIYPRENFANFMARDRELATFNSYTLGVGASYDFKMPRAPWINKSTANFRLDHLKIDYKDYRNALLTDPSNVGQEPLYELNANVLQLFVSIWF